MEAATRGALDSAANGAPSASLAASRAVPISRLRFANPICRPVSHQVAIALAILAAFGVLLAAMAWATAPRGDEPRKTENVLSVEATVTQLSSLKRAAGSPREQA